MAGMAQREDQMAKSKLFPGPRSVPKRTFASSAGNSQYTHSLPDSEGFEGSLGWKAGRSAGGISGKNRQTNRPVFQAKSLQGDGGLAYDASAERAMTDVGKPDKGRQP
jgi:hypothetical protein